MLGSQALDPLAQGGTHKMDIGWQKGFLDQRGV